MYEIEIDVEGEFPIDRDKKLKLLSFACHSGPLPWPPQLKKICYTYTPTGLLYTQEIENHIIPVRNFQSIIGD
jgi:hypothetical protein